MMQGLSTAETRGVSTPKALKLVYKRLPQIVKKLGDMGLCVSTMCLGQGLMELESAEFRTAQGVSLGLLSPSSERTKRDLILIPNP